MGQELETHRGNIRYEASGLVVHGVIIRGVRFEEDSMPEKVTKLPSGKYRVSGPSGVHAKATTKRKAEAQVRIIKAADKRKR